MIIYMATNLINGMSYVGQTTTNLNHRIDRHLIESKKSRSYFHRVLNKYGIENFKWKILKECRDISDLNKSEKYFIEQYKTNKSNGYNLTDGGEGIIGYNHSEKTKNKIRLKLMGHSVMGVTRKKISGNLQGHKQSKETKLRRKKTMETIRNSKTYRENLSYAVTLWWKKRKLMEV